jgi:hypothetical protein
MNQRSGTNDRMSRSTFMASYQRMNPPKHIRALGPNQIWSMLDPGFTGYTTRQKFIDTMKMLVRGQGSVVAPPVSTARAAMVTMGRF